MSIEAASTNIEKPFTKQGQSNLYDTDLSKNIAAADKIKSADIETIGVVVCGDRIGLNSSQMLMLIIIIKISMLITPTALPVIEPLLPFATGYLIIGLGIAALGALAVGMILAADPGPPKTAQSQRKATAIN